MAVKVTVTFRGSLLAYVLCHATFDFIYGPVYQQEVADVNIE